MPYAFLFIGKSGSGKGTQANLLIEYLKEKDNNPVFYLETGPEFRSFIEKTGFFNSLSKEAYKNDELQPDFLACYLWTDKLIKDYKEGEHLVLDGAARTLTEAKVLDTVFNFMNISKVFVIHIDVSRDWSFKRLEERGRFDDVAKEKIEKRLNWFDTDVVPAIEYYSTSPNYEYIEVIGEQKIEEVHNDIKKAIENAL